MEQIKPVDPFEFGEWLKENTLYENETPATLLKLQTIWHILSSQLSDSEANSKINYDLWKEVEAQLKVRDKLIGECRECLSEAIDLMNNVRSGDYIPDSFTTQPWDTLLANLTKEGTE